MAEVAISSLVASPTLTASATCSNIAYGFDINESNYAVVQSDANPTWIQIDFGETKYINSLRLRGGPDQSGSHVVTLLTSTDGTNWTTKASWSSQTYYSSLSGWITIDEHVRYVRVNRTLNNYLRLYYMGVTTDLESGTTEAAEATDEMVGISMIESTSESAEATATFDGDSLTDSTSESAEAADTFGNERTAYGLTTESAEATDTMGALHLVDATTESATATATFDGDSLRDSTSESAEVTDTFGNEKTSYVPTTESATATDSMDALHLVDSITESAVVSGSMEAAEIIRKRIRFPNLQGKHLSLKFTSATDGSFAIYYLRHKMFKTRELCSDQKHPNTQGSHIGIKLSNSGSDAFTLMYVSEKMQLVTT